jgi:hypothetical protein
MAEADVTTIKDRRDYYAARVKFLDSLLKGTLSPKQRRAAEQERLAAMVKSIRHPTA